MKTVKFITLHFGYREFSGNVDFIFIGDIKRSGSELLNNLKKTKVVFDKIGGNDNIESPKNYLNEVLEKEEEDVSENFPYQISLEEIFDETEKQGFGKFPKWFQILKFLKHSNSDYTLVFHY